MRVLEFYSSTAKELMLLEIVTILKKSNRDFTGGLKTEYNWPSTNDASVREDLMADWARARLRKGGLDLCIRENSTLWPEAKGVRIVTHACSNTALFLETIGLASLIWSSLVMFATHYRCIAIALKAAIYWLPSISYVKIASRVAHFVVILAWCDWRAVLG